jgi:hypothetical protein
MYDKYDYPYKETEINKHLKSLRVVSDDDKEEFKDINILEKVLEFEHKEDLKKGVCKKCVTD